jgi:hypothetical protein
VLPFPDEVLFDESSESRLVLGVRLVEVVVVVFVLNVLVPILVLS